MDHATIDCVLITNAYNMMALPYLAQGGAEGFHGTILATEPTVQLGKLLMLELAEYTSSSSVLRSWTAGGDASASQGRGGHGATGPLGPARPPYSAAEVEASLARVTRLNYGQAAVVASGYSCTPYSSGHMLGSANWLVAGPGLRLAFVGASAMDGLFSPNIQRPPPRHPTPISFHGLTKVDVAIFGDLLPRERGPAQPPPPPPPGAGPPPPPPGGMWPQCMQELLGGVAQTLQKGGCVLMPVRPCGSTLDLIDALSKYLPNVALSTVHTPIYLVSPVAESLIAYLEIMAEWVHPSRRDRATGLGRERYTPDHVFVHTEMKESRRLRVVSQVHELSGTYMEPCIVMAGHPSLRLGPCVHFLRRWAGNSNHALILTDPCWNQVGADEVRPLLQPYQPVKMKVMMAPLDCRLTIWQAHYLVTQLGASNVVMPSAWGFGVGDSRVKHYQGGLGRTSVDVPHDGVPATLDPSFCRQIRLRPVGDSAAARVRCQLRDRDGALSLTEAPGGLVGHWGYGAPAQRTLLGTMSAAALAAALRRRGLDFQESEAGATKTVRIPTLGAEVVIEPGGCRVVTGLQLPSQLPPPPGGVEVDPGELTVPALAAADLRAAWVARGRVVHELVMDQLVPL